MRLSKIIGYEGEHSIHDTVEISVYFQVHKCRTISERSLRTYFWANIGLKNSVTEILRKKSCNCLEKGLDQIKNVLEISLFWRGASCKPREIRTWLCLWVFIIPKLHAVFQEKYWIVTKCDSSPIRGVNSTLKGILSEEQSYIWNYSDTIQIPTAFRLKRLLRRCPICPCGKHNI